MIDENKTREQLITELHMLRERVAELEDDHAGPHGSQRGWPQTLLHRFYTVLSSLYAGVLLMTETGRVEFANKSFCDLFNLECSPEELKGQSSSEIVVRIRSAYADPADAINRIQEILDRDLPVKCEEVALRDGRTCLRDFIPLEIEGKRFGRLWHHQDITERKRAEEEMRRLRNYLSNIFNSMPSVLIGVDTDGCVTQWNAAAERTMGIVAEDVRGQPLDKVLPTMVRQLDRVRQAMKARTVETDHKVPRLVDGETRYDDVTVYPLTANGVEGAVIRVDDVTDRVRIEEMMIQSEKMLSVGGLAAGMAHEINNPLGVILQASQNVLRRVSPDLAVNVSVAEECGISLAGVRQYLERREIMTFLDDIRQSGQRAADIVSNMLQFSRKAEGGGSSTDLVELLDRTLSLAASDYDMKKRYDFRQIEIVREYQSGVPAVVCQPGKIQQVFLNVLRNGAQAMAAARGLRPLPRLILRILREGEMVRVEIEDNGPGMDEATRKRVFEPFFSTKPPGLGTGLGLSVSYFIVTEDHGGTMSVESNPGEGARFIIRLPAAARL